MKSLNRSELIGHLTRDPELKQTKSGTSVCTFSIATNREWKDQDGNKQSVADFHNIVVWGKLAEICGEYLKKGKQVWIEGPMITRTWEDEATKKKMYRTEIHLKEMIMLKDPTGGNYTPDEQPEGIDHFADDEVSIENVPF